MYRHGAADRGLIIVGIHGEVWAIDRITGEHRWKNKLPSCGAGEVFIAISNGEVLVSAEGSKIVCLSYATGQERWRAATTAMRRASIVVEADQIICAKGGHLDCFRRDGSLAWKQTLHGAGIGRIALGLPGYVVQADDVGS